MKQEPPTSGNVDGASAAETVTSNSIFGQDKVKSKI